MNLKDEKVWGMVSYWLRPRTVGVLIVSMFLGYTWSESPAQVSPPPITSSGLNTQVSAPVNLPGGAVQHNISGGTRPGGGANLFHSFGEFGVPTNNIANFLNDSGLPTSNILSRVTGGNPSNILGMIKTEGFEKANLFLMNPAGIVFGPNASLNVGGAAHFTTADYLRLADGAQFTAMPSAQDALLSIYPVAAFGFLGTNPASISVDGSTLSVEEGQTLSLVGGDIKIGSSALTAGSGKIALASVASPGEMVADTYRSVPNINGESFATMGNIVLSEGATLNVSGDAGGSVIIRGGELMMTNARISADTVNSDGAPVAIDIEVSDNVSISTVDGPALTAGTTGTGNAGEIKLLSGGAMEISGTASEEFLNEGFFSFPIIDTHTSGPGNGGNVIMTSGGDLTVTGDPTGFASVFLANTGTDGFDTGRGGDLSITARNFTGRNSFIGTGNLFSFFNFGEGAGSAGDVTISAADRIDLASFSIATDSFDFFFNTGGDAGNATLTAPEIRLENSNISTAGWSRGGGLTVNTEHLTLSNKSQLVTQTRTEPGGVVTITGRVIELSESQIISTTNENANAGDITITATERLSLSARALQPPSTISSNSFAPIGDEIVGAPGNIRIATPTLQIEGGSKINSSSGSSGSGGTISINADKISMSGQGVVDIEDVRNFGQFPASGLYTSSLGGNCAGPCGAAGNVSITTNSIVLEKGAQINSSTTTDGRGGNINVNATDAISISGTLEDGTSGGVLSRGTGTESGSGHGGNITLTAGNSFYLNDGATVSASTSGPANAGNITIGATDKILVTNSSVLTKAEDMGAGGAISMGAHSIELNNATLSASVKNGIDQPGESHGDLSLTTPALLMTGGEITAETSGSRAAGNISIKTGSLNVTDGAAINSGTTGTGAGGTISLMADQNFILSDGATVSASSSGSANAGNIHITAIDTILIDNADVNAEALQASGGNITLTAHDTIQLTDSTLASSVKGDKTTIGGNITLDPDFIIGQNSQILAKAVQGQGGNITLMANKAVLLDSFTTTHLDASSETGISGSVTIQSPIQNLSSTITPLPQNTLPVTALYGSKCVAGIGGHFSTFVDSKAGSLAPSPGTFLASPLLQPSVQAKADNSDNQKTPVVLTASIAPLVFGHAGESTTTCP